MPKVVFTCDECGFESYYKHSSCPDCEVKQLRAIVAKLPKDAEGKPIAPDDHRWCVHDDGRIEEVVIESVYIGNTVHVGGLPGVNDDLWDELADELYGTHEAADAAEEA